MINPGSDVVVLPPFSCVGSVALVYAVTVTRDMLSLPERGQSVWVSSHASRGYCGGFSSLSGSRGTDIQDFAELSESLVALTRKGSVFTWTSERKGAFEVFKSCQLQSPILSFPTEADRFVLDREMLAAVTICTHFRSYLRGAKLILHTARWYMLLGKFSVTFEYRPGAQHANVDGLSRPCGQCLQPDCPVRASDLGMIETGSTSELADQTFAELVIGDSMD